MTTHDGEIIRRSLEQPAAFAELYDRHERVIYRYAARRLGVSDADDIASETLLVKSRGVVSFRWFLRVGDG